MNESVSYSIPAAKDCKHFGKDFIKESTPTSDGAKATEDGLLKRIGD
jgi:hypothetical protein